MQSADGGKDTDGVLIDALREYTDFLRSAYHEDAAGQKNAARTLGLPTEVVADRINELAVEHMGDILLEESDCGFTVIEDYRETLTELTELG